MKFSKLLLFTFLSSIIITSCSVHTSSPGSGKIPPGQAKKMTGSKSAKQFAPGQQKK